MEAPRLVFSDSVDCTIVTWAPNGLFLAHDSVASAAASSSKTANQTEIVIRDVKTQLGFLKAFHYKTLHGKGKIDCLTWSSDSCYIAVGLFDVGIVHIFCLDSTNFRCKLEVGNEMDGVGLIDFCWSPRSRHVLTTAADHIQMTIWPLSSPATSRNILYVREILPIEKFKAFSEDGSKLAIAQYDTGLDGSKEIDKKIITIYNAANWKPEIMFPIKVKDLVGIKWSPDPSAQVLLFWDSPLFSNLYLYSHTGELIKHISPDGLAPGIKTIEWSITGQFLVFSNHTNTVRILNGLTYGNLLEETIDVDTPRMWPDCVIYKEEIDQPSSETRPAEPVKYTYSICPKIHHSIVKTKSDADINCAKIKTDNIQFSWDGKYTAIYLTSFSNVLWIWDLETVKLCSVLIQRHSISDFKWDPEEHRICVCTAVDHIYFWTPAGSFVSKIPEDDLIGHFLQWNVNGSRIVISSPERMSCCTFNSVPT